MIVADFHPVKSFPADLGDDLYVCLCGEPKVGSAQT
ncbi:hypothetical protein TRIP_B40022 [uncultured Desulfatiglans sp.]|nr:hypothetical protein TRIP_B40022 [uncultured Desulfatiglans sp.]